MYSYFGKLIVVLSLVLLIISCDDKGSGINYGRIEGRVVDAETNQVIEKVEISTVPPSFVIQTNVAGFFEIKNLVPGQYEVKAFKTGYKTKSILVTIQSGKLTKADILLEKGTSSGGGGGGGDAEGEELDSFSKNLIIHYKFDNSYNEESNSMNNMTGIGTSFVNDRYDNASSAVRFTGSRNSYAYTNQNTTFNLNEFTYSCWIKPRNNFGTNYNGYIDFISRWGHWGANNQSFAFSLGNNGKIKGMIYALLNPDSGHPGNYTFFESRDAVKPEEWSHVVFTYSKSNFKVYINGELNLSTYSVQPQNSNLYGLYLGKRHDDNQASFFAGDMDDLKVYNTELSAKAINQLFGLN